MHWRYALWGDSFEIVDFETSLFILWLEVAPNNIYSYFEWLQTAR